MHFYKTCFWLCFLTVLAFGQNINPDITVITDFRAFVHNQENQSTEKNKLNFDLHEMELAVQGYLNPYSRADIFIAKHGLTGDVEIEEASASFIRGLPLGLNIKVGKYLVDFSKLNTSHPHTYPFIDRPLLHTAYFGEDGWNDIGVQASILLPTGSVYTLLSVNVLQGNFNHHHDESDVEEEETESEKTKPAFCSRLSSHWALAEHANCELGVSAGHGVYDVHEQLSFDCLGADIKIKWRPNQYRSLTLQTEALYEDRDAAVSNNVHSAGFCSSLNYQFQQRWNIGATGEWLQLPGEQHELRQQVGIFIGFAPMEESSVIRLLLCRQRLPQTVHLAMLQVLFSLGPHKAHQF
jgi:hypothetical protein